jgi:hypothetical protein
VADHHLGREVDLDDERLGLPTDAELGGHECELAGVAFLALRPNW